MRGVRALAGLAAVLAGPETGCGFVVDESGARFRCGPGDPCPAGTSCSPAGYCESDPADGGADAGGSAACGTSNVLHEDFAAGTLDLGVWVPYSGIPVSVDDALV